MRSDDIDGEGESVAFDICGTGGLHCDIGGELRNGRLDAVGHDILHLALAQRAFPDGNFIESAGEISGDGAANDGADACGIDEGGPVRVIITRIELAIDIKLSGPIVIHPGDVMPLVVERLICGESVGNANAIVADVNVDGIVGSDIISAEVEERVSGK